MSKLRLPVDLRPNVSYRACDLGVDLPAEFIHDLRSIDDCLYPIWHGYRLLWDDLINDYAGLLENPRYQIARTYGELNFGFVLTNGKGAPTQDGHWHIWRLCRDRGWAHVINIDSRDPAYLNLLVHRLHLQAQYNDKYGHRGYSRLMETLDEEAREKSLQERQDLMNEIGKANSAMMSVASQNFARGKTAPTNPTKEIIMSGGGLTNKSKIIRPLDDKEGGLILPEDWEN